MYWETGVFETLCIRKSVFEASCMWHGVCGFSPGGMDSPASQSLAHQVLLTWLRQMPVVDVSINLHPSQEDDPNGLHASLLQYLHVAEKSAAPKANDLPTAAHPILCLLVGHSYSSSLASLAIRPAICQSRGFPLQKFQHQYASFRESPLAFFQGVRRIVSCVITPLVFNFQLHRA